MSILERLGRPIVMGSLVKTTPKTPTRVERGMAFLDEHYPGWRDRVQRYSMLVDVADGYCCPLALASGSTFAQEKERLGLTTSQCAYMGFCSTGINNRSWIDLTQEWRTALSL